MTDEDVKVFLIEFDFECGLYGGEIPARDWPEAEAIATKIGARVLGVRKMTTCMVCGEEILADWPPEQERAVVVN